MFIARVLLLSCSFFLGPLWVVVKFAENGSLIDYIREHKKQDYGYSDYINTGSVKNESKELTPVEKLRLAYGIAKGMEHLAKVKVRMPFVFVFVLGLSCSL